MYKEKCKFQGRHIVHMVVFWGVTPCMLGARLHSITIETVLFAFSLLVGTGMCRKLSSRI